MPDNDENIEPYLVVQRINKDRPWDEVEVIPGTTEMKGRYSLGPSYLEIFKEYIKATGECMEIHRLFYYAARKVFSHLIIGACNSRI